MTHIIQVGSQQIQVALFMGVSKEILPARSGNLVRTSYAIQNVAAAGTFITITKGDTAMPASSYGGISLQQYDSFVESTDDRVECWQGAVQGYATANGAVTIIESFGKIVPD